MNIRTSVNCRACLGEIIEKIGVVYGKKNGIIGPGGSTPRYVVSEGFHCDICGIVYKPTRLNRLNPHKINDEIEDVVLNSNIGLFSRSLEQEEIVSGDNYKIKFPTKGKEFYIPIEKNTRSRHPIKYFLVKKGDKTTVIDDSVKYKETDVKMVKKIGNVKLDKPARQATLKPYKPEIPKNAIPATMVFTLDRDFKKHYFYIPSDAIEKNNL